MSPLTSDLTIRDYDEVHLEAILSDLFSQHAASLRISLAAEYDRKGYPTRENLWPKNESYRSVYTDEYVFTIEVKVPVAHLPQGSFKDLVEATEHDLKEAERTQLLTKAEDLKKELQKVNEELNNL